MKQVFASSTLKSLLAAGAVAATALSPIASAPAYAGDRDSHVGSRCRDLRDCDGYYGPRVRHHHGTRHHYRRHDNGSGAAAAILGITGAAIIAGALSNANPPVREYRVAPNPYPPAPRRGPNVITYESSLEPWTPQWYRWCDARYRSFNPQTGTFRGYDGLDHFCVPR